MDKLVLACAGDDASLAAIRERAGRAEVIAVTIDLLGGAPLLESHDAALAAGAARCHVLDVREAFVRDALLPALRSRAFADPHEAFAAMALDYVARLLREVAAMEGGEAVVPDAIVLTGRRPAAQHVAPVQLAITFADGVPVAVNGVEMTLTELIESVETISGESVLDVLAREYAALAV